MGPPPPRKRRSWESGGRKFDGSSSCLPKIEEAVDSDDEEDIHSNSANAAEVVEGCARDDSVMDAAEDATEDARSKEKVEEGTNGGAERDADAEETAKTKGNAKTEKVAETEEDGGSLERTADAKIGGKAQEEENKKEERAEDVEEIEEKKTGEGTVWDIPPSPSSRPADDNREVTEEGGVITIAKAVEEWAGAGTDSSPTDRLTEAPLLPSIFLSISPSNSPSTLTTLLARPSPSLSSPTLISPAALDVYVKGKIRSRPKDEDKELVSAKDVSYGLKDEDEDDKPVVSVKERDAQGVGGVQELQQSRMGALALGQPQASPLKLGESETETGWKGEEYFEHENEMQRRHANVKIGEDDWIDDDQAHLFAKMERRLSMRKYSVLNSTRPLLLTIAPVSSFGSLTMCESSISGTTITNEGDDVSSSSRLPLTQLTVETPMTTDTYLENQGRIHRRFNILRRAPTPYLASVSSFGSDESSSSSFEGFNSGGGFSSSSLPSSSSLSILSDGMLSESSATPKSAAEGERGPHPPAPSSSQGRGSSASGGGGGNKKFTSFKKKKSLSVRYLRYKLRHRREDNSRGDSDNVDNEAPSGGL